MRLTAFATSIMKAFHRASEVAEFCPVINVPDAVWNYEGRKQGRDTGRKGGREGQAQVVKWMKDWRIHADAPAMCSPAAGMSEAHTGFPSALLAASSGSCSVIFSEDAFTMQLLLIVME